MQTPNMQDCRPGRLSSRRRVWISGNEQEGLISQVLQVVGP